MTQRTERIVGKFADLIPSSLEGGVVYISTKYRTASHLCCCGCGNKVVTPLKPGGWTFSTDHEAVSLNPSIGNWSFPCKSHYWIRDGRVLWAKQFSQAQINAVRRSDQQSRQQHFDAPRKQSVWRRIMNWIFGK